MSRIRWWVFPVVYVAIVFGWAPALEAKISRLRVVWKADPAHEAVVGWHQESGNETVLYYDTVDHGTNVSAYRFSAKPCRRDHYMEMNNRFVELRGLAPDSPIYFVIVDSDATSERSWFRTAPDTAKPFTFVAGGDTKSREGVRERGRRTNRMVPKLRPLFVVFCGDFCSSGVKPREWKNWLSDWSEDTRSSDGRVYPLVPVRGNHEPEAETLYRLFGLDSPDNYFSFNVAGPLFRFYALNSEINIVHRGDPRENKTDKFREQTAWLTRDLEEHTATKFKIAAFHKPFRPHTRRKAENHYLYDAWAKLFHDHQMSMGLEGDSHMHKITYPVRPDLGEGSTLGFVRDDQKGTMYVGEGSWGAGTRENNDDKPWTMQSGSFAQCKWLHVGLDLISLRTVITEKGKVDHVGENSESNVFAIPSGITFFEADETGTVVEYPLQED